VQSPSENGDIRENDEVLSNLAATCEALSELREFLASILHEQWQTEEEKEKKNKERNFVAG
jgi:hypothetical protein